MLTVIILLAVAGLAYGNGANDNIKGVATLFGSGATNYRGALIWATATTFLGSLAALVLAGKLLKNFSGRGLVVDSLAAEPNYVAAVGLGAGLTVLLATRIGMPVSTTHSLVGALVGAGWAADSSVDLEKLAADFFSPLLASPILAIAATSATYFVFRASARKLPIARQARSRRFAAWLKPAAFDRLHFFSAGVVSFARGLNDTPKIAALLLLVPELGGAASVATVGAAIAVGGLVSARKVAELMSRKITPLDHGQGLTANLITGVVVIGASKLGLPVSTTHVSCGALFGIGAVTRQARWNTILKIVLAWITTLPVAAALGAVSYRLVAHP